MYEIKTGTREQGIKIAIYGVEGIGKSTFAASFPKPVFIDTEGSTAHMNVARFPDPTSWQMLMDEIKQVSGHPETCSTLVIDTIDWAESLCIESVCIKNGKDGIEDFGYGQGYTYVKEAFGKMLNALDDVVNDGIHVVLVCHAAIRTFTKPDEMGQYDRYELKLTNTPKVKITEMVKEWVDILLFANYKSEIVKDDKTKKNYLVGNKRMLYTQRSAAFDAKNRFDLPEDMEFSYKEFNKALEKSLADRNIDINAVSAEADRVIEEYSESKKAAPLDNTSKGDPYTAEEKAVMKRLPQNLQDLMIANAVHPAEIEKACVKKGYFPDGMSVADYPEDFIQQVLVQAWNQVFSMIELDRPTF